MNTRVEKGITLVALIITIVVLLILAVVSIGAVQNSGIIAQATNAKTEFEKGKLEEQDDLKKMEDLLGEKADFYGPTTDGKWIVKTSRAIMVINEVENNIRGVTTHNYMTYNIEESINSLQESQREAAINLVNNLENTYGKINEVIAINLMTLDEHWNINGVVTSAFGIMMDNNKKIALFNNDLTIKEVISLEQYPTEEINKIVCKKNGEYETYVLNNIGVTGVNDAQCIVLIDSENSILGMHLYSEEMKGSMGNSVSFSLKPNDASVNVTLNGEDKVIDSTFFKIEFNSRNIGYIDSDKEKIYIASGFSLGTIENGTEVIEIEKSNFDINELGYIFSY